MKKIFVSLLIIFSIGSCYGQTIVNRAGASNTVSDSRHQAALNAFLPRYADTTAANVQKGIDSCGAKIYTRSPQALWYRACSPKRWVRIIDVENYTSFIDTAQKQSITNISIISQVDSSVTIEICTGADACDTITYTTSVTNATSVQLITDSSISVCSVDTVSGGTVTVCDTITIGQQNVLYFFQNALSVLSGSNGIVVEHGGNLLHNTTMDVGSYKYTITGGTIYDYPLNVSQIQGFGNSTSVASFLHTEAGSNKFGINYTDNDYPALATGYFGSTIRGYLVGTNITGNGSYGMGIGDNTAKVGGLIFHTKDTTLKDAVTIYGARPPLISQAWNMQPNTMDSTRIAVFKHDKQVQFKGYGQKTRIAVPNSISGWDINGNFIEVDTANMAGSVTFIDSSKVIICSFGNYLCDTIFTTEGGLMSIYADNGLTKRNDSTLIWGGTLDQNTTVNSGGFNTLFTGNNATEDMVTVTQAGATSNGVNASAVAGVGVRSSVTTGTSFFGLATTGLPGYLQGNPTTTNDVSMVLRIGRGISGGGTAANGIGGSIDFYTQSISSAQLSNQIKSRWSDATTATRTSQLVITGVNSGSTVDKLYIGGAATQINATRFETYKGGDIVAANDLTLGTDGNVFTITGNTQINALTTANWQAGSVVHLIFTGTPTLKDNTAGGAGTAVMQLAGSTDFVAAAEDVITLVYDGTDWHETSRKYATTGGTGVYTANNGLTMTANNTKLGGTLIENTTVAQAGFTMVFSGTWSSSGQMFQINNSGTNSALGATNAGGNPTASFSNSSNGNALLLTSSTGVALRTTTTSTTASAQLVTNPASTNSVVSVLDLQRTTSGTAATGLGAAMDYSLEAADANVYTSNSINSKWSDATAATRTSTLTLTGVLSASTVDLLVLAGNGSMKLRPITATAASAITPAEGMLVFVSDTNGTFVSIGIWCYQNAAWKAL
jgi:hypothetical protein